MLLLLFAQAGDPTISQWAPVVANLGVSVSLVMYLVVYANPKERREWAQTLKDALKEQRNDHERWQKDRDEGWGKIIGVITDARFEILKEVRDSMRGSEDKIEEITKRINEGFQKCMDELVRGKRGS
jgi:hypothetical protein